MTIRGSSRHHSATWSGAGNETELPRAYRRLLHAAAVDVFRDLEAERDAADHPREVRLAVAFGLERVEDPVDAEVDAAAGVLDEHLPQPIAKFPAVLRAHRAQAVQRLPVQLVRDEVEPVEQVVGFSVAGLDAVEEARDVEGGRAERRVAGRVRGKVRREVFVQREARLTSLPRVFLRLRGCGR